MTDTPKSESLPHAKYDEVQESHREKGLQYAIQRAVGRGGFSNEALIAQAEEIAQYLAQGKQPE